MMKRISVFWELSFLCFVLVSISCEKPHSIGERQAIALRQGARDKANDIQVVNGHLTFANSQVFSQTVRELNQTTDLSTWESHFQGYISLRRAYNNLHVDALASDPNRLEEVKEIVKKEVSSDGNSYSRTIIDDLLATLVNDKGLLQVGDTLYKINDVEVRSTNILHEAELANESSTYVRVKKVERRPIKLTSSEGRGVRKAGKKDGPFVIDYEADGRSHKFVTEAWALVYFFEGYWSTGVKVVHRRKQTFGWSWSNAFNWNAMGGWSVFVDAPRSLINYKTIAPPTIYESDEFQPYRYSESGVTSFVANRYVSGSCEWIAVGRDGKVRRWYHHVDTTL